MGYVEFDKKAWKEFQPQRAALLRETLAYAVQHHADSEHIAQLDATIQAIEHPPARRWWQFWRWHG
jgi:hypothetical protein